MAKKKTSRKAKKKTSRKAKTKKPVKGKCPPGYRKNKRKVRGHAKGTVCVRSTKKRR